MGALYMYKVIFDDLVDTLYKVGVSSTCEPQTNKLLLRTLDDDSSMFSEKEIFLNLSIATITVQPSNCTTTPPVASMPFPSWTLCSRVNQQLSSGPLALFWFGLSSAIVNA